MVDSIELAAGFVVVRNKGGQQVYQEMANAIDKNPRALEQTVLNGIVKRLAKSGVIKYQTMNKSQIISGRDYYEIPKRYFSDTMSQCAACIVIQNNWIVSKAAKIYRFKETAQWVYDRNGYYSSPTNKYLTYTNAIKPQTKTPFFNLERDALINALAIGQILNRSVILPKFHCNNAVSLWCPLNSHIYIRKLDQYIGESAYREHMFLKHPKVPQKIKDDLSQMIFLDLDVTPELKLNAPEGSKIIRPSNPAKGLTPEEIITLFKPLEHHSVLQFHSLTKAFAGFTDESQKAKFTMKVHEGVKKAPYRQY